ncbi:hypothetical protein [Campylobacter insulaenigrae]|uniref:hypothetical protein n=1 Tax=Campylobacter insulaenigrae TaxID=260714 RepID=UPI000F829110|nr:hypothetical protein [Campylobacter insulaenigrae]
MYKVFIKLGGITAFNTPIFQEELIELNIKLKIEDLTHLYKTIVKKNIINYYLNNLYYSKLLINHSFYTLKTKNLLILKHKNNSAYKLGKSLIKAHKAWYKGGYIKFIFSLISFCFNKNINKLK